MDEYASDSTVSETAYASILPRRMGYVAKVPEVQKPRMHPVHSVFPGLKAAASAPTKLYLETLS
jgi:hypothetical protein